MALDAELKIVDGVTVDVSASATPARTATFEWGQKSFPMGSTFVVHITNTADDNALDPVRFYLCVSVDDEVSWHRVAVIDLTGNGSMKLKGPYSVPCGPMDFRPEGRAGGADSDIALSVEVVLATTGSTDDFTYDAYIAGPNPYPHFSNLGVYQ